MSPLRHQRERNAGIGLLLPVPAVVCAGVDEAGRGCLAGPVVAAAVVLPPEYTLSGLTDSKKLSPQRREELAQAVRSCAVSWGIGLVLPREIDRINILQATFRAMFKAARVCASRGPRLEALLVDGPHAVPSSLFTSCDRMNPPPEQKAIVDGDVLVPCISAASILAKTFRDKWMRVIALRWPGYGFERHKGYGTEEHLAALAALGPCPLHRLSFRRVRPEPRAEQAELFPRVR